MDYEVKGKSLEQVINYVTKTFGTTAEDWVSHMSLQQYLEIQGKKVIKLR